MLKNMVVPRPLSGNCDEMETIKLLQGHSNGSPFKAWLEGAGIAISLLYRDVGG